MAKKHVQPDQFKLFEVAAEQPHVSLQQLVDRIDINKDAPDVSARELLPEAAALTLLNGSAFPSSDVARLLRVVSEADHIKGPVGKAIGPSLGISSEKAQILFACSRKMALLTDKPHCLTTFGKLVLQHDPYLDSLGTLWLMHYLLASNAGLVSWSRLFDIPPSGRAKNFTVADVANHFPKQYEGLWTEYGLVKRAKAELTGVLRLYKEMLFAPLKLVAAVDERSYRWIANPAPVPAVVFLATALVYRDRYYPGSSALAVSQLVDLHFAPGRLMALTEPAIRKLLDELHAKRLVTIETRADLDQVRFKEDVSWLDAYALLAEDR